MIDTAPILPAVGFHQRVAGSVYRSWDAVSQGSLWEMRRSPGHYLHALTQPDEPTNEMAVGDMLHAALFEPERLNEYAVWSGPPRNTKAGKEAWAEFLAANEGKTVVEDGTELGRARGMAQAIRACRTAAKIVDAPGECELSMLWKDDPTGLMCRGRLDKSATLNGRPTIVELKTTADARRRPFAKKVETFGYHFQAAAYCAGYQAITGEAPDHVLVVVEQDPPHGVMVYVLNDQTLATGAVLWRRYLDQLKRCRDAGVWPVYPDKAEVLDIGPWAMETEEA